MFGFLPEWVGDTLTLVAIFVGTPGVILWFLNRKGANRKLEVEEGGLTVAQFTATLPAYQDLLNRAGVREEAANQIATAATERAEQFKTELEIVENKLDRAILLFQKVIARSNIELTQEEMFELESTKPSAEHRRSRKMI